MVTRYEHELREADWEAKAPERRAAAAREEWDKSRLAAYDQIAEAWAAYRAARAEDKPTDVSGPLALRRDANADRRALLIILAKIIDETEAKRP